MDASRIGETCSRCSVLQLVKLLCPLVESAELDDGYLNPLGNEGSIVPAAHSEDRDRLYYT